METCSFRPYDPKLDHRSIALPYVSHSEGIQSLSEGSRHYLGSYGAYYCYRGLKTPKSKILGGLATHKSHPYDPKLKHRSITLPQMSPTEGMQSLSEEFLCYLASNGDYYASRGSATPESKILGGLLTFKSCPFMYKLDYSSTALPYVSPKQGI